MEMTSNINKHKITNEIVRTRQLIFSHVTFLSLSEVSVVFSISSSHANTNYQFDIIRMKNF